MKLPADVAYAGSWNISVKDKSKYQVKVVHRICETKGFCANTRFCNNLGISNFINCISCLIDVSNSPIFKLIVQINSC